MNSSIKPKPCSNCGSPYHSAMYHKPRARIVTKSLPKRSKRPKQIGKGTVTYNQWRDEVARPYLIATYGEVCSTAGCEVKTGLDVDHKLNRGSHPELKMALDNVQLICRYHHQLKTDRITI